MGFRNLAILPWKHRKEDGKKYYFEVIEGMSEYLRSEMKTSIRVALETENEYEIEIKEVNSTPPIFSFLENPWMLVRIRYAISGTAPTAEFLLQDLRRSFEHWYNAGDNAFTVVFARFIDS